ncbi:stage V sporulation protein AA [Ornithinibacillus bavariensis]|uniref:Stage V sporulation protein AA n=1 Tax=Ornithinibacillus bavariensis TaxID=545502 RepID=A0A919X9V4_9BACI|nr:stage V sporulation protein AA [Ornithinibacillus bavariensis]GIO28504.1 stage V sporulation protein AA [Ornithinibacillus bavariensis]HAM81232.1 stage V sporulation protein AA [Ornithinibacillus sp.]
MTDMVYLRMKKKIEIDTQREIKLQDIAFVSSTSKELVQELLKLKIYRVTKEDKEIVIIDSFLIIKHLNELYPNLEIQLTGPEQTIVKVDKSNKNPNVLVFIFVWLLLFIGTAMTIVNFHYDVSMQEVQQKLHFLLTGEKNEFPLWIQIPYSLGLGIGMILFFNHWFNKRFNEEPSPLEVEIYKYQQSLDDYVNYHENKLNDTRPPH